MSVLRARMKPGCRPIIMGGVHVVPEHPTYWVVPADYAAGVEVFVKEGTVEYEPALQRAPNGTFAAPGLAPAQRQEPKAAAAKFQRKGR